MADEDVFVGTGPALDLGFGGSSMMSESEVTALMLDEARALEARGVASEICAGTKELTSAARRGIGWTIAVGSLVAFE